MAVLQTTEVPVGSAGTPSLTFTGRTNDGIYSPADDQVAITTGGTQRLLVGNATLQYNTNDVAVKNSDGTLTIADGTSASHAVTKSQLDAVASGLDPKGSVRAASTANVSVTYNSTGGTSARGQITAAPNTLDGVSLAANNRILLKDQSTGAQNGIWVVTTVGTGANGVWDRATDFDADAEVTSGAYVWVEEGTTNADNGFVLTTNNPITIGGASGTALTFVQFNGAGQITAGAALTKTGNTLDVAVDSTTIEVSGDALRLTDNGVSNAKLRDSVALSVIGRSANSTGDPADISGTASSDAVLRISGTTLGFGTVATAGIANDAVTNAKLANMAQNTIKGRITASTGDPEDITADNLMTILNTATTDINDARLSSNVPLLNVANSFTAANVVVPVALTDAANIATNAALSNVFTVTLGGNRTLDNPTNPTHGQSIIIHVKQDATGSRTLSYGSAWEFKGSAGLSTTANATDVISATYNSTAAKWFAVLARADSASVDADTLDGLDSTAFLRTNGANTATAAITMDDTTHFWINLSGLTTTGIKWDTTANQVQFQDAGTTRAYIDLDNGELSATSIVETSDERLKEDIVNIDGARALKQVKKLQGVYFTRKDTKEREVGFIAQRVKALEPMLVNADNNGMLSVAYSRVTALLVEAIKEQQELIDTMRQEIDALKNGDNSSV